MSTAGKRFRDALTQEQPLQIVGAINAYAALMAEQVGFRCLYLSAAAWQLRRMAYPIWVLPRCRT
ncbi:MAG: hypothetical protein Ct9H300mP8_12090 [Gammaproteobacteria bacterium]|nr:MAG: hypothetical protein Ct9H300mP8_12090 [Gammaproteobacteria bacterium]